MKKKFNDITYTVQGEWFPETTLPGGEKTKPGETVIDTEMRLFCACTRWAFNRLLEGNSRKELKKEGQAIFGLNSRYVDDAILKARAIIDSRKELLAEELQETKTKLNRAEKKLNRSEKDLARAIEAGNTPEIEKKKQILRGRKMRIKKLAGKLNELQIKYTRKTASYPK